MRKSKFLSIILCATMLISCISLSAFAVTFDDVENDTTVSWAKDSIHKMCDAGYIKGYEDGTFRPYRAITKIEAIILMSRMLGFENSDFADAKTDAVSEYNTIAAKYNSTYSKEISYLLYCGVLKETDLVDYVSMANANTQLLRYQAAILMSKLLGADAEAKEFDASNSEYADVAVIPASARPYVEYVTSKGIMNGMDATADGKPQFSPVTSLTRAQTATLLARLMDKLDIAYIQGEAEDVSNTSIIVNGKRISIDDATKVYSNGNLADISYLSEGSFVFVVKANNKAFAITSEASKTTTTLYGVVVTKGEDANGKRITIADYEDEDITATYTLASDCTIKKDDTKANFGNIMADDFVKLVLSGSKVAEISTEETKLDIEGTLVAVEYDTEDHVYIKVEDSNGNVNTYTVSTKGSVVSRDGLTSSYRELAVGDNVVLRLTYGKVTKVTATSKSEKFNGLLTEIIISNDPKVTITTDGVKKTYDLRSDVKITVAGEPGDIYDLRPNVTVSGTLDSSEVKTLIASTVSVNEKGEMVGVVTGKNTTYSVLTVEDEDRNTQSVYYNNKTNFLTSSGSNTSVKSIEKGAEISVVGVEKNGVFEATIVIVK